MQPGSPFDYDPWGVGGSEPPESRPARPVGRSSNAYSTASIVCGVLALVICPPALGLAGLGLGVVALSRGERNAKLGIGVSVVCTIIGILISAMVLSRFDFFR